MAFLDKCKLWLLTTDVYGLSLLAPIVMNVDVFFKVFVMNLDDLLSLSLILFTSYLYEALIVIYSPDSNENPRMG